MAFFDAGLIGDLDVEVDPVHAAAVAVAEFVEAADEGWHRLGGRPRLCLLKFGHRRGRHPSLCHRYAAVCALLDMFLQECFEHHLVFGVLLIGEASHGFAEEAPAVPGDVGREDDREAGSIHGSFPALLVGPPDEDEGEDGARTGDCVGDEVFAVGFEGHGAGACAEAFEP